MLLFCYFNISLRPKGELRGMSCELQAKREKSNVKHETQGNVKRQM